MDQHPIPQDVTGFQFKLIGTMTVKQFGYVGTGVILAVILYYLPLPGFFGILAKVCLIPILGGSGAFIAFVPIDGRPVDVMATNFFKAIFSPNQYVYRKTGRKFSFSTINTQSITVAAAAAQEEALKKAPVNIKQKEQNEKSAKLQAYLQSTHSEVKTTLDKKEQALLNSLALPSAPPLPTVNPVASAKPTVQSAAAPAVSAPQPLSAAPMLKPVAASPLPTAPMIPSSPPASDKEKTLIQQETQLEKDLQTAKQEETTSHAPAAHQKVLELEKHLQEVHAQKQLLERELQSLKNQLQAKTEAQMHATPLAGATPPLTASVQKTPPPQLANAPLPVIPKAESAAIPVSQYTKTIGQTAQATKGDLPSVSDTPNVVVGIVKDPRGNILPNMLVEVKDKDGNPVRAFKTNALGQFASATPLSTGVYTIELDDPKKKHNFDSIQISANNQIMMPIEIISHDAREELRQQLFN